MTTQFDLEVSQSLSSLRVKKIVDKLNTIKNVKATSTKNILHIQVPYLYSRKKILELGLLIGILETKPAV